MNPVVVHVRLAFSAVERHCGHTSAPSIGIKGDDGPPELPRKGKGRVAQKTDDQGRALFKDPDGRITTEASSQRRKQDYNYNREMETVTHQAVTEPIKYARAHIAGRTSGVGQHMTEVKAFIAGGNAEAKTMDATIRGHVWLDPAFAVPAVRNLQEHIKRATDVLARLEKAKQGFQQLPVEKDMDLNAAPDATGNDGSEGQG
ncbi:MAG: hypothetical protein HYX52_08400 [Chloroflexi bacterium]|nr:hypothetical protein [Chloroflexota bacterium]